MKTDLRYAASDCFDTFSLPQPGRAGAVPGVRGRGKRPALRARAGAHFADAVAILGIQTILIVLFRRAPRTFRGASIDIGKPPAHARGFVMRLPRMRATEHMAAGTGVTTWWGEVIISRLGTVKDMRLAARHEAVHRFFVPRLAPLRNMRINQRATSYNRSALAKYLNEAVAETIARVGEDGVRHAFNGVAFPVRNGYVTLMRPASIGGRIRYPFIPEAAGLISGGVLIGGEFYDLWLGARPPRSEVVVDR
jgi:hypothetical protein